MIYLACPYSHTDPAIVEARFNIVTKVAGWLMQRGYVVFSPITHSHVVELHCWGPGGEGWEFWQKQDLEILKRCDKLLVLRLPGWDRSVGVADEIAFAKKHGIERGWIYSSDLPHQLALYVNDLKHRS